MTGIELLGVAAGALIGLGAAETIAHRRRLARIPVRIHVSGTRGKSSVTRLIAAGLRAAGTRAAAKTTGTLARMIMPDGREVPVFRPAGANIVEQLRIVDVAAQYQTEALIIECMALIPELHWVSENKMVRATHGVITNIRPDHLDVMGPTEPDVARAIAGMVPVKGVLITGERRNLAVLQHAADDRGTRLVTVMDQDLAAISDDQMSHFRYVEHRENVALALKVIEQLGKPRQVCLEGMWHANPDPGALFEYEVDFFGREVVFVNGFAANDPLSTETIWDLTCARHAALDRVIAVFNLRADRPSRTVQLACDSSFWHRADQVVLMGDGAYQFARAASKYGVDTPFVFVDDQRTDEIFETIMGLCGRRTLVIGMANIYGQGIALARYFRNRSRLQGAQPEEE